MLEKLFSSRVRTKLLVSFFMSPGKGFNARELTLHLSESYSAVWKELVRLESIGILTSESRSNSKTYVLNPLCPIAPELRSMIIKTEGIGNTLRTGLSSMGKIRAAFVFGSYASGDADEKSDLDLLVIGDIVLVQFGAVIAQLEKEMGRPINYLIYSEDEWNTKRENADPFTLNVMDAPKIMLIGDEHAL